MPISEKAGMTPLEAIEYVLAWADRNQKILPRPQPPWDALIRVRDRERAKPRYAVARLGDEGDWEMLEGPYITLAEPFWEAGSKGEYILSMDGVKETPVYKWMSGHWEEIRDKT